MGFMLVLVTNRSSSIDEKVVGVSFSIFELCDLWTGDAGPSGALLLRERGTHGLAGSLVLIYYVWSTCKHYAVYYRRSSHEVDQGQVIEASWSKRPA